MLHVNTNQIVQLTKRLIQGLGRRLSPEVKNHNSVGPPCDAEQGLGLDKDAVSAEFC